MGGSGVAGARSGAATKGAAASGAGKAAGGATKGSGGLGRGGGAAKGSGGLGRGGGAAKGGGGLGRGGGAAKGGAGEKQKRGTGIIAQTAKGAASGAAKASAGGAGAAATSGASTAAGAALGGLKGFGKAMLDSRNRRKAAIGFAVGLVLLVMWPLVQVYVVSTVLGSVISSLVGATPAAAVGTGGTGDGTPANTVSAGDNSALAPLYSAEAKTGVPWEVLLAIVYYETGNGAPLAAQTGTCPSSINLPYCAPVAPATQATLGTPAPPAAGSPTPIGPFGLSQAELQSSGVSTADQKQLADFSTESLAVANAIKSVAQREPGWNPQYDLLTDAEFPQGQPPTIDATSVDGLVYEADMVAAIEKLPLVQQGKTVAVNVFTLAQEWALGIAVPQTPTASAASGCTVSNGTTLTVPVPNSTGTAYSDITLPADSVANAKTIITVGTQEGYSTSVVEGALLAGVQESWLLDLPNSSVPASLSNPNAQYGFGYSPTNPPNNFSSLGVFQQLYPMWGSVSQLMDVPTSAKLFYAAVARNDPAWQRGITPVMAAEDGEATIASMWSVVFTPWVLTANDIMVALQGSSCSAGIVNLAGDTPTQQKIIKAAEVWLGTPYVYGGGTDSGPSGSAVAPPGQVGQKGFDCSGLTMYVYWTVLHIQIPHNAAAQFHEVVDSGGLITDPSKLVPGDLVFFVTDGSATDPGHVGIYLGHGEVVNAPSTGHDVSNIALNQFTGFVGGGAP